MVFLGRMKQRFSKLLIFRSFGLALIFHSTVSLASPAPATSPAATVTPIPTRSTQASTVNLKVVHQYRHSDPIETIAFSPDGHVLATGGHNRLVHLWDLKTKAIRRTFAGHTAAVQEIAFAPDGKLLASGGGDGRIVLWDVDSGKALVNLAGHTPEVNALAFSPDGKLLASGGDDRVLTLWSVAELRQGRSGRRLLFGHNGRVESIVFSPDGKLLATGCWDDRVRLWDPATGKLLQTLVGHTDSVQSVCFSADGKFLASAGWDRAVRVWNVVAELKGAKREQYMFEAHNSVISAVCFIPGAKPADLVLATASWDKRVLVWDVRARTALPSPPAQADWLQCLAVSHNGRYLASGGFDGIAKVWQMPPLPRDSIESIINSALHHHAAAAPRRPKAPASGPASHN